MKTTGGEEGTPSDGRLCKETAESEEEKETESTPIPSLFSFSSPTGASYASAGERANDPFRPQSAAAAAAAETRGAERRAAEVGFPFRALSLLGLEALPTGAAWFHSIFRRPSCDCFRHHRYCGNVGITRLSLAEVRNDQSCGCRHIGRSGVCVRSIVCIDAISDLVATEERCPAHCKLCH